jgi:hypothetical protein
MSLKQITNRGKAFRELLEKKKERIVQATRQGKYLKMESPLWLLIRCNTNRDLRSEIFGSEDLRYAVDESGFDFANSPFDEIWLMEGTSNGRSQRLYPWQDWTS